MILGDGPGQAVSGRSLARMGDGSVVLPLTAPGVGAAATLVMLTVMKELPATLFLRPTGFETGSHLLAAD